MIDFSLEGRIALINGGSRGIGKAIAQAMAAQGAQLIIASRKQANIDATVQEIQAAGGVACGLACHAGKKEAIEALFKHIQEEFGRIDILVNNAATNPYFGPVLEISESAYDKTFEVNTKGYFLMAQQAGRMMLEQGSGVIINIASTEGISPEAYTGIYAITKASNIMLTKVLAKELGPKGIRCNCICPGLIKTDLSKALVENEALHTHFTSRIPLGRIGETQDLVGLALYLASDAAAYTNGAIITCDGGLTA